MCSKRSVTSIVRRLRFLVEFTDARCGETQVGTRVKGVIPVYASNFSTKFLYAAYNVHNHTLNQAIVRTHDSEGPIRAALRGCLNQNGIQHRRDGDHEIRAGQTSFVRIW